MSERNNLRSLLGLLVAAALLLAIGIAGNELVARQALCTNGSSRNRLRICESGPCAPHSDTWTVSAFTSRLSDLERCAWLRTPRYTTRGYSIVSLPPQLRAEISNFQQTVKLSQEDTNEHLRGEILIGSLAGSALETRLGNWLRRKLESWTGLRGLEFTNSYGPRTYKKGSTLAAHGDRPYTHALSAIVFVDSTCDKDYNWPLQFVQTDSQAEEEPVRDVFLGERGEDVCLYESTQPHGRVEPLKAEAFTVLFFHWRPKGWLSEVERTCGKS